VTRLEKWTTALPTAAASAETTLKLLQLLASASGNSVRLSAAAPGKLHPTSA